jgi:tetratricopeptide (TPR) repeat protein
LDIAQLERDPNNEHWLTGCLAFGIALEQITEVSVAGTPPQVEHLERIVDDYDLLRGHRVELSETVTTRISELTRSVAVEAEDRSALQMAYSSLALLERLHRDETSLEYGRVLALRGRLARKAGASELAEALYQRVAAMARRLASDELHARALIGRGVLAQSRGNYPEARRLYTQAARKATACGERSLIRLSYHGLMVVSAKFGQYRQAFTAGWRAFQGAEGDPAVEAEALINLGQLAYDVGQPLAALHGFAAALAREPAPWLRLPALGGAARAAAALRREAILRECAMRIEEYDADSVSFLYSRAAALLDASRAFAAMSLHADGARLAARVAELASTHGFHELVIEAENIVSATRTPADARSVQGSRTGGREGQAAVDVEQLDVLKRLTLLEQPDRVLSHRC